jgi:hypothetical protein
MTGRPCTAYIACVLLGYHEVKKKQALNSHTDNLAILLAGQHTRLGPRRHPGAKQKH